MRVLITSEAGTVDYTRHVLDGSLSIEDSINVPTLTSFQLSPIDNTFVVPHRSSYVKIISDIYAPNGGYGSGKVIATGFITGEPERTFLGLRQGISGQKFVQYSYNVTVTSDEWQLNSRTVPWIPAFVNQTDSQILAAIANVLYPGFDTSRMATGIIVPYFQYDPSQTWSDIAKTFADANRYSYKVLNMQIIYQPFGSEALGIAYDEQTQRESQLAPINLQTSLVNVPPVNDCIVIGDVEPQTNVDNYFVGDGFSSNFQLRHQVFQGVSSNLLEDDWTESQFSQGTWIINDPEGVITLVDSDGNPIGALNVVQKGAPGVYLPIEDATYIQAQNGLELGGGINLQHGQFVFNDSVASGGGIVGGIYSTSLFTPGNVLAGFVITGQQAQGPFEVISVTTQVNSNQINIVLLGTNTLQPGNVLKCSLFTNATFLNGQQVFVVSNVYAGIDPGSGLPSYNVVIQSATTYFVANSYTDTGKVQAFKNDAMVTASGAAGIVIQPIFSGQLVGQPVISQVNFQYVLQTWIGANAPTRFTRPFTNLTRSATYGDQNLASSGTISWVVTSVNLGQYVIEEQNPLFGLFPGAPPPVVTQFSLSNIDLPPFALYCLINAIDLNVSINYTLISEPPQGFLTVQSLTGMSGGNLPWLPSQLSAPIVYQLGFGMINQTAQISQQGEAYALAFYTDDIPSVGARIRFQSWSAGQSVARVTDPIAIANEAQISGDNGVRSAIMQNLSPLPRTSDECEAAAAAAILDREYPQFQGTYSVQTIPYRFESLYAPSLYADYPRTGEFFYVNAPSRGITGQNFALTTVRFQILELRQEVMTISLDYGPDLYLEKLLPAFLEREQNLLVPTQTVPAPNPVTLDQVLNATLPTLDNAQVTLIANSLTGNYIVVNLGAVPITGCEVRNVDSGWGIADQGRVGLFTSSVFTLPRTIRDQTWYLRTLNNGIFSRFSKALRVVYPLIPSAPVLVSSNATSIVAGLAGDVRDIYGIEVRALAASGVSGDVFIDLPDTVPTYNIAFFRRQNVGYFVPNAYVGTGPPIANTQYEAGGFGIKPFSNYQFGDIVYVTCSVDSSFNGLRILAATGLLVFHGEQDYLYVYEYNQPYPDLVTTLNGTVGTIQLVSRNGYALLASGSLINGIATIKTQTPHNLSPGQFCVIGAAYASGSVPSFIAPYTHSLQDAAVFTTTAQVQGILDAYTFTFPFVLPNGGGVNPVALVGLVSGIAASVVVGSFFIPGAPPGTILQQPVFSPSDLVINLIQPNIQATLKVLESVTPGSRVGGLSIYFFNSTWDYSAPTAVPTFTIPSISGLIIDLEAQTLNWSLATGIPSGHRVLTQDVTSGIVLNKYTIDHPDNPQLLTQASMTANDWLNPRIITITPFDALGDGIPSTIVWGGSSGVPVIGGGSALPPNPFIGDIIRYNVNGDTLWDAVNQAQKFVGVYCDGGSLVLVGPPSNGSVTTVGSANNLFPTATDWWSQTLSAAATASTNTVIGVEAGTNGNNSLFGILSFYRFSIKFAAGNTSNVRYWIGLGNYNVGSGTGHNNQAILSTTAYASDTPNKTTIGFRYSAGVDINWQAVTLQANGGGGSQTTVDTGITPDTNPHLFEIITNANGTLIYFLIDGNIVAEITTNIPSTSNTYDSLASMFWTGDNKNTATAISGTFWSMQMSMK